MKYDKQIKTLIHELKNECNEYLNYVNEYNECAFTDRKIEYIIDIVKRLEEIDIKRFKKTEKGKKVR